MKFPRIDEVAHDLMLVRDDYRTYKDPEPLDVRLQVYPDGAWAIRTGDSSYDQDHRGYWGASSVDPKDTLMMLCNTAEELIEQAKDAAAQNSEEVA